MPPLNFNNAPYYDDFDPTKQFYKILFKPGYSVQARELTQTQDILQNQISSFGAYVFKSGSPVLGGQATIDTNVTYANVNPTFNNTAINITQFANSVITDSATRTIRASVVATIPQITGSTLPPTLMIKYLTGVTFADGANVTIEGTNTGPFITLANTNSQGNGSIASIRQGIYYVDLNNLQPLQSGNVSNNEPVITNGYFINVPAQTIVLNPYDNVPTYRIGLQINDIIVTNQNDSSLYDPALGASNYQGPGADRYSINLQLATRLLTSTDDTSFIELMRIIDGTLVSAVTSSVLSDINTTLAKRTYDQSGNFTVKPFAITLADTANNDLVNSNTQNYYAILDTGKAYVKGYDIETIGKTVLTAPRARTLANVNNYTINTYYGNYLLIDTIRGEFPINSLPSVDLHCVSTSNVNMANATTYASTLIGTANMRALEYNNASNTSNSLTYAFRSHLFDVNTNMFIANCQSALATSITLATTASVTDNAYIGMAINIPSTGDTRTITQYVGSTKVATVNGIWSSIPANGAQYRIIASIADCGSLGINGFANFATANANINIGSIDTQANYNPVSLTDSNFPLLVFPFPNSTIAQGIQNPSYEYRYKVASGQTLSPSSPLVVNLSVPGDSSATFAAAGVSGSDLITLEDFIVYASSGGIIPMVGALGRSISSTTTTATFTMNASDQTYTGVDIYASCKTTIGAKTKTLVLANTNVVSSGTTVGAAKVSLTTGQILFSNPFNNNLTTLLPQDLYISDGVSIAAIIDSGSPSTAITVAMMQAAVNNTTMPGSSVNITNSYNFFNGQKDGYYDHCYITLKAGMRAPAGQVMVLLNYFSHSTTGGYFTCDSYPNYATIPTYAPSFGSTLSLRDCIDFRPRRDDATTAKTFNNTGTILIPEPFPNTGFTSNYAYYLPRIDRIVVSDGGNFNIIQGVSSLNAYPPAVPKNSMLLYTLLVPPYTFYSSNITPQMYNNKRYTMKDIGKLEQRIQNLEYYASLNQLEQQAVNQNTTDANGLPVTKNGILTDNFQGSSVADVLNLDYYSSIDTTNQQLRPPFVINNIQLDFNPGLSTNYAQNGDIITLPYTTVAFIDQSASSRTEYLNPFNVTVWSGTLKLDPESDTWIDTVAAPAVVTNLTGDNDAWAAIGQAVNDQRSPYSTVWNNWQTIWSGVNTTVTDSLGPGYKGAQVPGVYIDAVHATNGFAAYQVLQNTIQSTTTQTVENQVRSGIQTTVSFDTITKDVGTNIINISVIPYIRSNYVRFQSYSMKPLTNVYPFFDSTSVQNYVNNPNYLTFSANVSFQDDYQHEETIVDQGNNNNKAFVLLNKGKTVFSDIISGVMTPGNTFIGNITGATGVLSSFTHNSGLASAITSSSITLQSCASSTNGSYVGKPIYVTQGINAGVSSTITAYNGVTKIATVSPNWNVTANSGFYYSIGNLRTDFNGDICGAFIIPDPNLNRLEFPTGTSKFVLTDANNGVLAQSSTNAQDSYTAQGTLETTQEQYVSTRVPVLNTTTVTQSQTVTSTPVTTSQVIATNVVGYTDPVAQNFLIDNNNYPNGVFVTSIRLCFLSKDNSIPVTMQLRPTVNGYPSSSTIIPFSQVTLNPDKINVTLSPSLDNPAAYTEFFFDAPIFLNAGTEYSIILISNSNNYQIYTAAVGDKYLGSDRIISQPPYLGVLFKSQNSTTWTPYQGESLTFRVMKAVFNTTNPMLITMNNPSYNSNIPRVGQATVNNEVYLDTLYVTTSSVITSNTSEALAYAYRGTSNTSRVLSSTYTPLITDLNYNLSDRNVITPAGNNFYLQAAAVSNSQDISPIIDMERYSVMAIGNQINNGGISNTNITILNGGLGYNVSNTNIITITGPTGSGAQLKIGSVNASGSITSVYVPTGLNGAGYADNIAATVTTSGYSPTATANLSIACETNPSGGNFITRYITRQVTLADGMDAGDLQVMFNAHKPSGTQIYVYYKIMSAEDNDAFSNKNYVRMPLLGTDSFATGLNDFTSYTYVGTEDQYGNNLRQVSYGAFNTFKYFAIKIVMASSNPSIVPIINSLVVTALPSG